MLRLALRVRPGDAEVVLAELLEIAPGGVEEVEGDGWVEYAVYGSPGELPSLPDLEATAGGALVEVVTSEVDDDWADRWREFHKPLVIDGMLRVRPPWEPRGDERHDLIVDPGRAFGTGAHPTTSLCLQLLLEVEPTGSLLDLGCGSGVLAILAARLGFDPVTAVDNDPLAVDATAENALVNGVSIEVGRLDLRSDPVPDSDTLVANILAPVLTELAKRLGDSRPATVILSGILDEQADAVSTRWSELGYAEDRRLSAGGWTALLLGCS